MKQEILNELPKHVKRGRKPIYDFKDIEIGEVLAISIKPEETELESHKSRQSVRQSAYNHFKSKGYTVKTAFDGNKLYVQRVK